MEKGHISLKIAEFCVNTRYEDIPVQITNKMKKHILDTLGAGLAGALSDEGAKLAQVFEMAECPNPPKSSPIWGTGRRAGPRNSALANGLGCHTFELDDTGGCDHSGAVVIPAALACLPLCGNVTGKDFITAIVLGYETARRALESCGAYEPHNEAGWHSTATCGTFGAATAVAYLMKFNVEQMRSALGLAASTSCGLWAFIHDGAQSKKFHPGRAAEGGLLSALLAQVNFRGPSMIFDDVWGGFMNTFSPNSVDRDAWLRELGSNWKLGRVSIKPHASCRSTHAAIDAVDHLIREHKIGSENIVKVHVRLNEFVNGMCGGADRSTLANTQMSIPYGIAARLVYGSAGLSSYREEKRNVEAITNTLKKIVLEVDKSMKSDDEPYVTIHTKDNHQCGICIPMPLGSPVNPLSDEALVEKYHNLGLMIWPEKSVNLLSDTILNLDNVADANEINKLLSEKPLTTGIIR